MHIRFSGRSRGLFDDWLAVGVLCQRRVLRDGGGLNFDCFRILGTLVALAGSEFRGALTRVCVRSLRIGSERRLL